MAAVYLKTRWCVARISGAVNVRSMSIYVSAPTIARLKACSRIATHMQMRRGHFGPLLQRGRVPYAALDAVERHSGLHFTSEQIGLAIDGRPARVLIVPDPEQEAA